MKLLLKQRMFSWFGSFNVFDENEEIIYTVKGNLALGHKFVIFDKHGEEVGCVKEKVFSMLPKYFILDKNGEQLGVIAKKWSFLKPKFDIDFMDWHVEGNFLQWNYTIADGAGRIVATLSKELIRLTDTYSIEVENPANALYVLMFAVALDADKANAASSSN